MMKFISFVQALVLGTADWQKAGDLFTANERNRLESRASELSICKPNHARVHKYPSIYT